MTDTTKLAERIEALEGACREMDAEIAVTVLGMERDGGCFFSKDEDYVLERDYYSLDGSARELPHYTTSLDAVMTLADEDTVVQAMRDAFSILQVTGWRGGEFKGALARATVANILRAQEAHNG